MSTGRIGWQRLDRTHRAVIALGACNGLPRVCTVRVHQRTWKTKSQTIGSGRPRFGRVRYSSYLPPPTSVLRVDCMAAHGGDGTG